MQYSQPSTLSQILTGTKTIDELVGNVGGLGNLFGLNLSGQPANTTSGNPNPSSGGGSGEAQQQAANYGVLYT